MRTHICGKNITDPKEISPNHLLYLIGYVLCNWVVCRRYRHFMLRLTIFFISFKIMTSLIFYCSAVVIEGAQCKPLVYFYYLLFLFHMFGEIFFEIVYLFNERKYHIQSARTMDAQTKREKINGTPSTRMCAWHAIQKYNKLWLSDRKTEDKKFVLLAK